jgi:hypothetical protein
MQKLEECLVKLSLPPQFFSVQETLEVFLGVAEEGLLPVEQILIPKIKAVPRVFVE